MLVLVHVACWQIKPVTKSATEQPHDQVERGLVLDVVVIQRALGLEALAREDERLLLPGYALQLLRRCT